MTAEQLIALVENSKEKALRGESKLTPEVLAIRGFSTPTMRHFYNNLAAGVESFMEVGAYAGGVLISAAYDNNETAVYGWENKTQNFGVESVYDELESNLEAFGQQNTYLLSEDFFNPDPMTVLALEGLKCGVVVYDGEHSYESQRKAVSALVPYMKDLCLMCVDDAAWPTVINGTQDGLNDISETHEVIQSWFFTDGVPDGKFWHNSLAIYLIQNATSSQSAAGDTQ